MRRALNSLAVHSHVSPTYVPMLDSNPDTETIPDIKTISDALDAVVTFRDRRDWSQYHTPRHLSSALSIEIGELQEVLLWKTDEEIGEMLEEPEGQEPVVDEIGDILILALLFCQETGIDPLDAIERKLAKNAGKYPVDKARGRSEKYSSL